jgi:hypothetical protein
MRWTPDAKHVHASAYYAWILEGLLCFKRLRLMTLRSSRSSRLPHGLAGTASEAPGPARSGLGTDWQPLGLVACPRARTKTNETPLLPR